MEAVKTKYQDWATSTAFPLEFQFSGALPEESERQRGRRAFQRLQDVHDSGLPSTYSRASILVLLHEVLMDVDPDPCAQEMMLESTPHLDVERLKVI